MIIEISTPDFGKKLHQLRTENYLSQKALAKLLGISVHTLRGWENGTLAPVLTDRIFSRIYRIFDLPETENLADS